MSAASGSELPLVDRARLVEILGHDPQDDQYLSQACNHRSWCAENPADESNERLEFLGDAVLGFVVADEIYRRCPDLEEGTLTDIRKAVVSTVCLAEVAAELRLGDHLRLGKGEEQSGGREKESILADLVEAMLGAVFVEAGVGAARGVIRRLLGSRLDLAIADRGRNVDHKSRLQETAAARNMTAPEYHIEATGPDHAREFTATVTVSEGALGVGTGRSKKQAEQRAARQALAAMAEQGVGSTGRTSIQHDAGGATDA